MSLWVPKRDSAVESLKVAVEFGGREKVMPSKIIFAPLRAVRSFAGFKSSYWLSLCSGCRQGLCLQNPNGANRQCAACGHKKQAVAITKLGISRTREYHKFNQAKARCTCPTNVRYKDYGGRGIEWRFESYEQAYELLGPCPAGRTLDRINNNGHYEPGNVRWATWKQQFASRRPWNWERLAFAKFCDEFDLANAA